MYVLKSEMYKCTMKRTRKGNKRKNLVRFKIRNVQNVQEKIQNVQKKRGILTPLNVAFIP